MNRRVGTSRPATAAPSIRLAARGQAMHPVRLRSCSQVAQVEDYYNSARNAIYTRYSAPVWRSVNQQIMDTVAHAKNFSEYLRVSSTQKISCQNERVRSLQTQATAKLSLYNRRSQKLFYHFAEERAEELEHWSNEVNSERKLLEDAQEKLKEVADIIHWEKELKNSIRKTSIQMRLNNHTIRGLQNDIVCKQTAHAIDIRAQNLSSFSTEICRYPGVNILDNTYTSILCGGGGGGGGGAGGGANADQVQLRLVQ
ncbi:unnamed protein product [Schistocephalus solidus]|uniref:Tektin n=1 Tax=Schistocephalus solidus TaxID=70667 RepID=A0A183T463_SCHSO|nr:unnamed protein product [Schistocephalus solidus]